MQEAAMTPPDKNIEQFFWTARERQMMKQYKEAGSPQPWTKDIVLGGFRFCNVHRREDKVSKWIIDNLFKPMGNDHASIFMAAYVARWFNKIETLEAMKEIMYNSFDLELMGEAVRPIFQRGEPIFGSAYIIQSPTGSNKLDGILWAIGNVTKRYQEGYELALETKSMEKVHAWFMQFPHMGPFMAYQVVCDLTYTPVLSGAVDQDTWTCAGPGAARGLSWLCHDMESAFNYNGAKDQLIMKALMRDVLDMSRDERNWPQEWGNWELATVQHWSCEYDKYRRGHAGQSLKRRYVPCS
jgi:hypothetical protein